MGLFDRFMGMGEQRPLPAGSSPAGGSDEQALERYRYLLKTAPPETLEEAHAEAFARLTPEQRRLLLERLRDALPASEQASATRAADSPQALARVATRAEVRTPGTMERLFGGMGAAPGAAPGGMGVGGLIAGGFLSSMAGTVMGSMIAQHFLGSHPGAQGLFGGDAAPLASDAERSDPFHSSDGLGDDMGADAGDADGGFDADTGFDGGDTFDV